VTRFRNKVYFHLRDNKRNKNFSLEKVDMYELLKRRDELVKVCRRMNKLTQDSKDVANPKKIICGKSRPKVSTGEESRFSDESYGDLSSSDELDTM